LFSDGVRHPAPVTATAIGDLLRHALGLSAWKVFQRARWALRVNPSSGNLHPTEAYLVMDAIQGLADVPGVWHYAPDRHAIEQRCAFDGDTWRRAFPTVQQADAGVSPFLIGLTSIHWRESWKYGERAFRYCQHDMGHAIAALRLAAALHGWQLTILPEWPQPAIAALLGLDRDSDYVEAEREAPACLLLVTDQALDRRRAEGEGPLAPAPGNGLLEAARKGRWFGKASQLSEDHVEWTFIDEVARATEDTGHVRMASASQVLTSLPATQNESLHSDRSIDARGLMLQRRSAVSLDGVSSIDRVRFVRMLSRVVPGAGAPWDALWWSPRIHLALFVHRVNDVAPGLYLLARDPDVVSRLRAACHQDFRWEAAVDDLPLWLLQPGDYRLRSKRVSCDQDIAADGFFSLGMIADFDASLSEHGPAFYRHLFWESGVVGQVLYLEAEAAGARATGIGCFFDDAVHELLGLQGHAFQSLYHFTVGMPVEDTRLQTEPGYAWDGLNN